MIRKLLIGLVLSLVFITETTTGKVAESQYSPVEIYNINVALQRKQDSLIHLEHFLGRISWLESHDDWKVINRYGFVGKYQFGYSARKAVGEKSFSYLEFRNNPDIWPESQQELAMVKLMQYNHNLLIKRYPWLVHLINRAEFESKGSRWYPDGTKVKLTWSGVYAAAHLVGYRGLERFIFESYNRKDGNTTSTFDYLKWFEDEDSFPIESIGT